MEPTTILGPVRSLPVGPPQTGRYGGLRTRSARGEACDRGSRDSRAEHTARRGARVRSSSTGGDAPAVGLSTPEGEAGVQVGTCSRTVVRRGGGRSLSAVLAGRRGDAPLDALSDRVEHLPGRPFLLGIHRAQPAGGAGSENRRPSAASTARRSPRPSSSPAASTLGAGRSTMPTARAGESPVERPAAGGRGGASGPASPARRPGRGTAGPDPRGLPAGRRRARSAAARPTRSAQGPAPEGPRRTARAADGGAVPGGWREPSASSRCPSTRAVSGWASDARRELANEPAGGPPGRLRPRQSDSTSDTDAMPASRRHLPYCTRSRSSVRSVG